MTKPTISSANTDSRFSLGPSESHADSVVALSRRRFAISILSGLVVGGLSLSNARKNQAWAQEGNEYLDREVYIKELYCYTDEQKQFVDDVLGLVAQNRLPAKLVISCFQWARKKPQTSRRFYYFSYSLYAETKEQGFLLSKLLGYSTFEPQSMFR